MSPQPAIGAYFGVGRGVAAAIHHEPCLISNPDMINPGQIIEMPQPPKSAALRYFVLSRPSSGKFRAAA